MPLTRTLAIWQNVDLTNHDLHGLMWAGIVIAISMAVMAVVIVIAAYAGMKVQKNVMADVADLKAKIIPLAEKAQALTVQISAVTTDLAPVIKSITGKIDTIATHVENISALAHQKAEEFAPTISAANETVAEANETVRDVNRKTQQQIERVNGMVSSVLDATAAAGNTIRRGLLIPVREFGGLATGIKAAFGAMLDRRPPTRHVAPIQIRALPTSYRNLNDVPPDVLDEGTRDEPLQG